MAVDNLVLTTTGGASSADNASSGTSGDNTTTTATTDIVENKTSTCPTADAIGEQQNNSAAVVAAAVATATSAEVVSASGVAVSKTAVEGAAAIASGTATAAKEGGGGLTTPLANASSPDAASSATESDLSRNVSSTLDKPPRGTLEASNKKKIDGLTPAELQQMLNEKLQANKNKKESRELLGGLHFGTNPLGHLAGTHQSASSTLSLSGVAGGNSSVVGGVNLNHQQQGTTGTTIAGTTTEQQQTSTTTTNANANSFEVRNHKGYESAPPPLPLICNAKSQIHPLPVSAVCMTDSGMRHTLSQ